MVWIKGKPESYYIWYAFATHGKMPAELRDREDDSPGVMQVCFRHSDKKPLAIKLLSGIFPLTRSGLRLP